MKRKFEEWINEFISKNREILKENNIIYIISDFEDNYIWNYFVNYIFKDLNLKYLIIKKGSYYLVYDGRNTEKVSLQEFEFVTQKTLKNFSDKKDIISDFESFESPLFCIWKPFKTIKLFTKENKRLHKKWEKVILKVKNLFRRCIIKRK